MPNTFVGDENNQTRRLLQAVNARVLLAEDNVVNQDVAVGMFEFFGCDVTVAVDGGSAVEACQAGKFDVIFMDCQMPQMNGYLATAAIRDECPYNKATPIIALTANAMEGDRERCLKHGMSDYLSKPVKQDQLHAKLVRWAEDCVQPDIVERGAINSEFVSNAQMEALEAARRRQAEGSREGMKPNSRAVSDAVARTSEPGGQAVANADNDVAGEAPVASNAIAAPSKINMRSIDAVRSLQRPGKPDILTKVIHVYVSNTPSSISDMQAAFVDKDFDRIKENAHSMKSSSSYLGADAMSDMCKRIEQACKIKDEATVESLIASVALEYEAVEKEFISLTSSDGSQAA